MLVAPCYKISRNSHSDVLYGTSALQMVIWAMGIAIL